jgi:hypothetical protein
MADPRSETRRWWLPSLSTWLWLLFFLGLSLSNWRLVMINADGDPCLHWRIGNWMIEHHEVIRADHFSHTRDGAPLVSKEWLSEMLFASVGNLLGWNGIVLLSAALIARCLWLLHRMLLAEGNELLLSTGLVLLAATACSMHWLARPHLFTHVLSVVFLWQLRAYEQGRVSAARLYAWLVPLMALWTNLHGAFFTGLVLIGVFLVGNFLRLRSDSGAGRRSRMLGLLLVACLLASLINPNNWRLHAHILEFLRTPIVAKLANEFRSPNFHSGGMTGFAMQLLVLAVMLIVARPRLSSTDILLIGVWGYFALHAVRNVPVFALIVTPILAEHLNAFLRDARETAAVRLYRRISAVASAADQRGGGKLWGTFAVLAMLFVAAKPRLVGGEPILATEIMTNRFPVAAVQFLQTQPDAVGGEMFNDYGWGGYLMLTLPKRKVFMDGRNDFYGEAIVKEFKAVADVRPGWETILEKYNVGWTILPSKHALNTVLALHPGWKVVYTDEVAAIRARITP